MKKNKKGFIGIFISIFFLAIFFSASIAEGKEYTSQDYSKALEYLSAWKAPVKKDVANNVPLFYDLYSLQYLTHPKLNFTKAQIKGLKANIINTAQMKHPILSEDAPWLAWYLDMVLWHLEVAEVYAEFFVSERKHNTKPFKYYLPESQVTIEQGLEETVQALFASIGQIEMVYGSMIVLINQAEEKAAIMEEIKKQLSEENEESKSSELNIKKKSQIAEARSRKEALLNSELQNIRNQLKSKIKISTFPTKAALKSTLKQKKMIEH